MLMEVVFLMVMLRIASFTLLGDAVSLFECLLLLTSKTSSPPCQSHTLEPAVRQMHTHPEATLPTGSQYGHTHTAHSCDISPEAILLSPKYSASPLFGFCLILFRFHIFSQKYRVSISILSWLLSILAFT